ncbi:MAG: prolyl oligopeptidase family serine peptidase [Thermomicrobiales bacterium]
MTSGGQPVATKLTYQDYANVISYGPAIDFSPDGNEVAYTSNASGQFNLWVQPLDGGEARQLTRYTDKAVRDLAWSPVGDQVLFTADTQGDEKHQLYLIDPAGSESEKSLTDRPDVQYVLAQGGAWSPDGHDIAYAGNDREPTAQDAIIREVHTGEIERPLMDGRVYFPVGWSPDGKKLTVIDARSNTELLPLVVDIETGIATPLAAADEPAVYAPGPWKGDGSGYWMLTDKGREYTGLAFVDAASGEISWVLQLEWDVETVAASKDGKYLAWSVNEDGYSRLHLQALDSGEEISLPELPGGVLKSALVFSPAGDKLAFQFEQATQPAEIYLLDIASGEIRQLTESRLADFSQMTMVAPDLVRFEAFDGLQIPAWLFRPEGDGPFPVVYSIHGGPEYQERPTYAYRGLYQYLLSQGIGVLATNIRGSSGYGKSYQKLIHRDLGGNDVKDFEAAAKFLRTVDWVDPQRIAVFGGSYGGFAVLTCLSRLPEYWAAGVDIVGPSNLVTMLKSFPPTWKEMAKTTFGDVDTEEEDLLRRSPITYVDQIVAPLFVIQGANDPRVVKSESDQIVEQLRSRGVDVRYDVYDDEGHGFTRKENELKAMGDSAAFLTEHLLPS